MFNAHKEESASPQFSPLSLIRAVWKHKWSIVIIWVLGTAITFEIVRRLPPVYRTAAKILVESQRIPPGFVAATVTGNLQSRLNAISQQVLSYERLVEIIERFDLYPKMRERFPLEVVVQRMRIDIGVRLVQMWSVGQPGAINVSYKGEKPVVVAQVANQIANLFIDENLRSREIQALGTSEFLDKQLSQAKDALQRQEEKLSNYKVQNMGQLPEQQGALLANAANLQARLQAIQDALNRADEKKLMLQNDLQSAEASLKALEKVAGQADEEELITGITSPVRERSQARPLSPLETNLKQATERLQDLRLRYSDEHPDVRRERAHIARLLRLRAAQPPIVTEEAKQPINTADGNDSERAVPTLDSASPLIFAKERIESLESQMALLDGQVVELEENRQETLQRLESLQAAVEKIPVREQEMISITRDYGISKNYYQQLLNKKMSADLAADMERRQKAERFVLLDRAHVPFQPVEPDRVKWNFFGSTVSLVVGVALAFARELKKNVVLGEWELPNDIYILGRVPYLHPGVGAGSQNRKKRLALISSLMAVAILVFMLSRLYWDWDWGSF